MRFALNASLVAAGLLLASPVASALPSSAIPHAAGVQADGAIHQIAKKHHGKHGRRKGCRLTHDGLVCGGGGKHSGGGHKPRHGKGHGNGHGGNQH